MNETVVHGETISAQLKIFLEKWKLQKLENSLVALGYDRLELIMGLYDYDQSMQTNKCHFRATFAPEIFKGHADRLFLACCKEAKIEMNTLSESLLNRSQLNASEFFLPASIQRKTPAVHISSTAARMEAPLAVHSSSCNLEMSAISTQHESPGSANEILRSKSSASQQIPTSTPCSNAPNLKAFHLSVIKTSGVSRQIFPPDKPQQEHRVVSCIPEEADTAASFHHLSEIVDSNVNYHQAIWGSAAEYLGIATLKPFQVDGCSEVIVEW